MISFLTIAFWLSLVMAVVEILIAINLYRNHRIALFSSLFYYVLLMNIFSFYGYFQQGFAQLVFWDQELSILHQASIQVVTTYLAIPFLIVGDFMFIRFFRFLIGRNVSRSFAWIFFSIQLLIFVSTGIILMAYAKMEAVPFYGLKGVFERVYLLIDVICMGIAFSQYFIYRKSAYHPEQLKASGVLTLLYFCLILPSYAFYFVSHQKTVLYALGIIFIHTIDLPPLLFLRHFVKKQGSVYQISQNSFDVALLAKQVGLTKRETEIVTLICEGRSNREIAEQLFISLQTVKDHVYHVFQKTGVSNRVQLTNLAGKPR